MGSCNILHIVNLHTGGIIEIRYHIFRRPDTAHINHYQAVFTVNTDFRVFLTVILA